jgi:hypothetical protein
MPLEYVAATKNSVYFNLVSLHDFYLKEIK